MHLNVLALIFFSVRQTRPRRSFPSVLRTVGHSCDAIAIYVMNR